MSDSRTVHSICPYCAVGCGLLVEAKNGVATTVRGDPQHPSNFGKICPKGALLPEMLRTPDRLLYPQIRESLDEPFRRVTWDEALEFVASRFQQIIAADGPDAVAFYGSGQLLTEDYYLLGKLAKGFIGTNNQDTNSRLCMASASAAYSMAFGQDGPPSSYADIEKADCFLILGANMEACHPVLYQRVKARKRSDPNRVKVIVIDPRRTETASIADSFLPVRPGTDVPLLNAMLHEIVLENLIDQDYIDAHTEAWEELRESVREFSPERVSQICGVDAQAIRDAALMYGRAGAALSLWAMGANQSVAGVDKNLAIINMALATGNIGRPGAGPFSLTGQPNAMGGREGGGMAHTLPGHRSVANAEHRAEIERYWGVPEGRISPKPGKTAVDMFKALSDGDVKALWVAATNPVASMPRAHGVKEAMQQAELIVVQDAYHPTETTRYAHVLLPAAQWSEREGTMTNSERRVNLLEKVGDPPGEALPDWKIFCRFAEKMGFGHAFAYESTEEIFNEFKETTRRRDLDITGITYERLRWAAGIQWPAPVGRYGGVHRLYTDGKFETPSGRAKFHTLAYRPPAEPVDDEYPFVLTTGRVRDQWHTRTRTGKVAKLVKGSGDPYVEIHDEVAKSLGIRQGDMVEIRSRRGAARMSAKLSSNIEEGTIFTPFHWGELWSNDTAINNLTVEAYDPVSKEPELKYCAVQVAAVASR